ncbi:hypothetical protein ACHAP8_012292 [Fusarium lateritium]
MKLAVVALLTAVPAIVATPTPEVDSETSNAPARRAYPIDGHSRRWNPNSRDDYRRRVECEYNEEGYSMPVSDNRGGCRGGRGRGCGRGRGGGRGGNSGGPHRGGHTGGGSGGSGGAGGG